MGGVPFEEGICSCGNATGKPVVFGWAAWTGGRVFLFCLGTQQIPAQGSFRSFPFMISGQRKVGTCFKNDFLIEANQVHPFLLAQLSVTLGILKEHYPSAPVLFPPTWQKAKALWISWPVRQLSSSAGHFWLPAAASQGRGSLGCHAIVQSLCSPRDGSLLGEEIGFHCWAGDTWMSLIVNPASPTGAVGLRWQIHRWVRVTPPGHKFPLKRNSNQVGLNPSQ